MEKLKILTIILVTNTALNAFSDPLAKFYKKSNKATVQEIKEKRIFTASFRQSLHGSIIFTTSKNERI